ncbi:zinc ribbon domain-containing protein [Desulfovibrio sp. UCD-KL4C]|uniref:FmdB family zinc ribbon protein n=1 Tax=Desulfovibrio sp. UCD-KL4C TaxID=2578120 RepID=UPI0025C6B9AC|nr:zinc ribbon domain-containing protein [Desulfovibrio sp. UCD-KL4C]
MPIYEFKCNKCGKEFDELVMPGKDIKAVCPECGKTECEKLLSKGNVRPNGIPKGKGGYKLSPCHECKSQNK